MVEAATFVLVHGNWHGGWCWVRVADGLRAAGHRVLTPTQTGLGERRHLFSAALTLDTYVADIANVIEAEELREVVLVGHSFAGLVISGVADRMADRLRRLVFLDAVILQSGQCLLDGLPPEAAAQRRQAIADNEAHGLPPLDPHTFGVGGADRDWLLRRLTPQPAHTHDTPLRLARPLGNGLPCSFIACTDPALANIEPSRRWARAQPDWDWHELRTGHDAMVTAPEELTRLLGTIACA
ncbi:MAG: alpha/beta fold hydrolase [Geminicoccaceae bacterium]